MKTEFSSYNFFPFGLKYNIAQREELKISFEIINFN
jgi:hypothetical protein